MSTYLDFIPSPASIKAGETEVHTGNPVDQVTITGDVNDFGVVIANQATDGDARITFSNNDRSYTLGLNGVSGSTNEDFRIVVGNNINTGTNVLSANQFGHLTIGRTTLTGGLQLRARTVTANTTLVNETDHIIFANAASGNIILTLPANNSNADGSSTVGKEYIIIKTDSSANTVQIKGSAGTPGDSVNGSTNYLLRSQNETATVVRSTSSSWLVTASNKLPYFGNGSATNPSISFESDPDTGIYRPGSDQFGITTGGASRMVISSAGIDVQNHKIAGLATPTANSDAATKAYVDGILTNVPVGTVGAAGLAFVGDPNTGIYRPSADQFGITTGGASRMVLSSAGINVQNHKITGLATPTANSDAATKAYVDANAGVTGMADGAVATPGWAFTADTNTGFYRPSADNLSVSVGGTLSTTFSSTGLALAAGSVRTPNGAVSNASFGFSGDVDTGMYLPAVGELGFTVGGAQRMRITPTRTFISTGDVHVVAPGSAAEPAIQLGSTVGIYRAQPDSRNSMNVSIDDVEQVRIDNIGLRIASGDFFGWIGDATKGIVDSATNAIAVRTANVNRLTVGLTSVATTVPVSLPAGSVIAPTLYFNNDTVTGLYGTSGRVFVASNGVDVASFNNVDGTSLYTGAKSSNGNAAAPSYAFVNDPDTGIYRGAIANEMGFATGGASRMVISSAGINVQNHKITGLATPTVGTDAATKDYVDANAGTTGMADGTAAAPGWAFDTDPDTGFYRFADNMLAVTAGGSFVARFSNTGLFVDGSAAFTGVVTLSESIAVPNGSATSPTYTFTSNTSLGLYRVATNTLGITAGGTLRLAVSSAGIDVQNHKITGLATPTVGTDAATKDYVDANAGTTGMADGTAAAPGWAFTSDTDTGLYLPASNQIGLATDGTPRMILSSSGINVQSHNITNLATPTATSHATTKGYVDAAVTNARVMFAYGTSGVSFIESTTMVQLTDTNIQFSSSPGQWFTVQVLISCTHTSDVSYPNVKVSVSVGNATVQGYMLWKTDAEQYSKRTSITGTHGSTVLATEPGNAPTEQYTVIRGEGRFQVITPPSSGPISFSVVGAQATAINNTTLRADMVTLTRTTYVVG